MARKAKAAGSTLAPAPHVVVASAPEEIVTSIKGFDRAWKCRDYQFVPGETFTHPGDVEACAAGFHAIEGHPLEVFDYYPPGQSRYAEVTQSGKLSRHSDDSKVASAKITIGVELHLHEIAQRAVKWVIDRCTKSEDEAASSTGYQGAASSTGYQGAASSTGYQGAASSTGYQGAASSTGYQGAASSTGDQGAASSTGDRGAASSTGDQGAASSTGDQGAASSTGDQGAASSTGYQGAASSTGDQGAASSTGNRGAASSTGYQGAASSTGDQGAASSTGNRGAASSTGYQGAASSTGDQGAASSTGNRGAASSTGYQGAASSTGDRGAAMAIGHEGRARGAPGNALFLVYRHPDNGEIKHVWAGIAGSGGIKPLVFYMLGSDGLPKEVVDF